MEYVNCNLCNKNDVELVHHVSDWLLNRPEHISTFVRCKNCGLIYQNPRPTQDEIYQFYPPEYEMYQVEDEINASSPLMRLVMNYGIYKRCRIVMREKTEGILLDVGCATGIFLEAMQKTNRWITKGVEISEQAARIARDYKHLDVITGNLEKADLPNDYFDVVTLWDVLEHLHDPVGSLREIYRILKPNGIIVFRVPNAGSLDARLFSAFWAGFDAPRHLYVFERSTLGIMLGKTGFNVIQMKCDLGSYPASVMSLRFWLSGNSVKPKKRKRINRFVNSLFARVVFAPFFFLINRLNLGSSLTVVAGKR